MKDSIRTRLEQTAARFEEVSALLADPQVIADQSQYRDLSREYARLEPVMEAWRNWQQAMNELEAARGMLQDTDDSVQELAREEEDAARARIEEYEAELQRLMLPRDQHDDANIYLEIRAAAGGDEAGLFAGDLLRMYTRYAENQGWQVELISGSEGEHGGYKSVVARIIGRGVYSRLKFESGAHRVQRVPETESQGRIHTSTCTVAVLPEADELDEIEVNPADLRVDTYRASGAGGQHVNKTDSAVRLTHLPSGIVVECQDERSQHKNRARAMSLLAAKLLDVQLDQQAREAAQTRKSLVGTGDRSERIRTYNFPQGRVTDHRINLTLYQLEDILAGNLDAVVQPLIAEHQAELLASLGD